jgi:hypothetical protein
LIRADENGFNVTQEPRSILIHYREAECRCPAAFHGERNQKVNVVADSMDLRDHVPVRRARLTADIIHRAQERSLKLWVVRPKALGADESTYAARRVCKPYRLT